MSLKLSVLDQSVAMAGRGQDQSIRQTVALAIEAERLGYARKEIKKRGEKLKEQKKREIRKQGKEEL